MRRPMPFDRVPSTVRRGRCPLCRRLRGAAAALRETWRIAPHPPCGHLLPGGEKRGWSVIPFSHREKVAAGRMSGGGV